MKPVTMFIMETCPYCKQALAWMEELKKENPMYQNVEVTIIDETKEPDVADQFDYYYVPTYYVDNVKVHEGVATREIVEEVFKKALE